MQASEKSPYLSTDETELLSFPWQLHASLCLGTSDDVEQSRCFTVVFSLMVGLNPLVQMIWTCVKSSLASS